MTTSEGFVTFNLLFYDQETQREIYGQITSLPKTNKYLIEGEEDVNKVIILTRCFDANTVPEDKRNTHMEAILKEWGVNKGLWLTEMRIKQKIDKIQPLVVAPSETSTTSTASVAKNGEHHPEGEESKAQ